MEEGKETPKASHADLLSLPEEVFYNHIFPKLEYRDILRLRWACKPVKIFCDDFLRNNFTSQVREINESTFTLQHFLQANLPTSSIFINNSSPAFFTNPLIPSFLNLYGNQITSLKINHFATFNSEPELHFFSALPNLLHLDITFIDATQRDCYSTHKSSNNLEVRNHKSPFPPNFKNLKTLKLNKIQGSQKNDVGYAWDFINFCENLEYVKHPLYNDKDQKDPPELDHPFGHLGCVMDHIKKRHQNQPNLQFYDLEHFNSRNNDFVNIFENVVAICIMRNVKLLNVNSDLVGTGSMKNWPKSPVVSLRNVRDPIFMEELPNLEKLVVESTKDSSFAPAWCWPREAGESEEEEGEELVQIPEWPKLRILDLRIDSRQMLGDDEDGNYADCGCGGVFGFSFCFGGILEDKRGDEGVGDKMGSG